MNEKNQKKRSLILRIFLWGIGFFIFLGVAGGIAFILIYNHFAQDLPKISTLKEYHPPIITTVYSDDNRKIAEFFREKRIVIPFHQIPKLLIQAFIAAEDDRYYSHPGVDFISIFRAFIKNIEAGEIRQGGSTITQQVIKSFLLTPEKKYERKIKEAILAYRIDKAFTKDEILYLYLNQIFLGHGAYGVEAAAQNYFAKSAKDLNLAECAMLAGLPKAPSRFSPFTNFEKAKERQMYVLKRMVEVGFITKEMADEAARTPLEIHPLQNVYYNEAPHFAEHVRRYLESKYGADTLYEQGLEVFTTVNLEMQKYAVEAIDRGLRELDKRQGYRGPIEHVDRDQIEDRLKKLQTEMGNRNTSNSLVKEGSILKGIVTNVDDKKNITEVHIGNEKGIIPLEDMRWARKPNPEVVFVGSNGIRRPSDALHTGDVIWVKLIEKNKETGIWKLSLEQTPEVESAMLCIETGTGFVKAMIGGRDFSKSQFNRAIQAKRQPGSAFKGIIYGAAIDKGYTPATEVLDTAIVIDDGSDKLWKPQNYDRKFSGPTLVRNALAKSLNLPTIRILNDIGVDYLIGYAKKLGITSDLYPNLSIALGASEVTLLELVSAYSVFANYGLKIEPIFITKILDRFGNVLEENKPKQIRVIEENSAYIMTNLLQSVITQGTGKRAMELNRPCAGKTGTTNSLFDAWFVGYTPDYVAGVWVGFDEEKSLGKLETGGKAACPIWLYFMKKIHEDKPIKSFEVPKGIVFAKIDANTGLLANPDSQKVIEECFKDGTQPKRYSKVSQAIVDDENFFKSGM